MCISAYMDDDQLEARAYLDRLMAVTGETLTNLARGAGMAPSTLTRFHSDAGATLKHTLGLRTIRKLEERWKVPFKASLGPISAKGVTPSQGGLNAVQEGADARLISIIYKLDPYIKEWLIIALAATVDPLQPGIDGRAGGGGRPEKVDDVAGHGRSRKGNESVRQPTKAR